MAKGPELTSAATNPDHAQHVANVSNMIGSATPEQRIGGIGWYRSAAQDTMHIASGIEPGTLTPHPHRVTPGSTATSRAPPISGRSSPGMSYRTTTPARWATHAA